jgi:hypothetical protein
VRRLAGPGCTRVSQIANTGGRLGGNLGALGVLALILAGVLLSFAMRRAAGWRRWAWPTRWTMLLMLCVTFGDIIGGHHGLGGLFERLLALLGAAWLGAVAVAILGRTRKAHAVPKLVHKGADQDLRPLGR